MISRTDLENQNFQTCPNQCDWRTEVFKNNIFLKEPKLIKEWSDKNKIPIHLSQTTIETKKYWWIVQSVMGHIYVLSQFEEKFLSVVLSVTTISL